MNFSARILSTVFLSFVVIGLYAEKGASEADIHQLWLDCGLQSELSPGIFRCAMSGYSHIDSIRKKNIITVIDLSKPSTSPRFFVIDLQNKQLLYKCFVAHGRNSGGNFAESFSNEPQSLKSSQGFFLTAEIYYGLHGCSLRLDGLEENINDNARIRQIVIHGAGYVSSKYINEHGRLGRSWGCPALPVEMAKEVIEKIFGGSCLFIYGTNENYLMKSTLLGYSK